MNDVKWIYPVSSIYRFPGYIQDTRLGEASGNKKFPGAMLPLFDQNLQTSCLNFLSRSSPSSSLRWSSYIEMVQFGVEFRFPHLCSFPIFELFCNCNCIPIRTQPTQNWPARCIYSLPSQNARGFEKGKRQSEQISLKRSFSFFLEKIGLVWLVMVVDL